MQYKVAKKLAQIIYIIIYLRIDWIQIIRWIIIERDYIAKVTLNHIDNHYKKSYKDYLNKKEKYLMKIIFILNCKNNKKVTFR